MLYESVEAIRSTFLLSRDEGTGEYQVGESWATFGKTMSGKG